MATEKVKEVNDKEARAFRLVCRQLYVDSATELNLPTKVEEAVVIVGMSPAKAYVQVSSTALREFKTVLIAGKGGNLGKAVAVAEQVKQQLEGYMVQFNKASLHSSLINPAYKPSASLKNIQVFLNEIEASQESMGPPSSEQTMNDALREIQGHKVYQVPSIAILLVRDTPVAEGKLPKWTRQNAHE